VQHTNRFPYALIGYHMDVNERACLWRGNATNPPQMLWVRPPQITFPGIPGVSMTATATITHSPYLEKVVYQNGNQNWVWGVWYRWTVRNCVVVKPICNSIDYRVIVDMYGTRIQTIGSAPDDPLKAW